ALTCPPLAAARVHLEMRIELELADLDQWAAVARRQALLRAAVGATSPATGDERRQLVLARAATERRAQIHALDRVEAEGPHPSSGESAPVARLAKRGGGGGDDPEGRAVLETETLGRRRAAGLDERIDAAVAAREHVEDLGARHDLLHRPARRPAHVHVLDESHLGGHRASELDEVGQPVVVPAA